MTGSRMTSRRRLVDIMDTLDQRRPLVLLVLGALILAILTVYSL